jgi:hypothetical protein
MDNQEATYQIKVLGEIDSAWSGWFADFRIETVRENDEVVVTSLIGPVADQAALRGILCRLWDLNLTLMSVIQIDIKDTHKMEV